VWPVVRMSVYSTQGSLPQIPALAACAKMLSPTGHSLAG